MVQCMFLTMYLLTSRCIAYVSAQNLLTGRRLCTTCLESTRSRKTTVDEREAQGSGTYLIQASSDMHGEASVLDLLEDIT